MLSGGSLGGHSRRLVLQRGSNLLCRETCPIQRYFWDHIVFNIVLVLFTWANTSSSLILSTQLIFFILFRHNSKASSLCLSAFVNVQGYIVYIAVVLMANIHLPLLTVRFNARMSHTTVKYVTTGSLRPTTSIELQVGLACHLCDLYHFTGRSNMSSLRPVSLYR